MFKNSRLRFVIHAVAIICVFFAGFIVARHMPQRPIPTELNYESDDIWQVMWHRFGEMTFDDMRQSITERGPVVFYEATSMDIIFDNYNEILSVTDPHVLARGFSRSVHSFVHVLFTFQHGKNDWSMVGYSICSWGEWNIQP